MYKFCIFMYALGPLLWKLITLYDAVQAREARGSSWPRT